MGGCVRLLRPRAWRAPHRELGWLRLILRRVRFRCECAGLDCNQAIEVTVVEYERVREDSRQFVIAVGHELPDVETVVEIAPGYVVVRKRDVAGPAAEELDPRR